ncbi:hypothetical protein BDV95DRAFT_562098 [Massariosphaeria phaeospora]|uniref:Uncharacterized protein n=1 Tax=Massariosphaeria phaeospora TaxID=100035 RepID=A0A7C8IJ24_9PLEO|nr:hypothetical protein BDV95DRAFT_562098 [Massariosphaeria phaeospora]
MVPNPPPDSAYARPDWLSEIMTDYPHLRAEARVAAEEATKAGNPFVARETYTDQQGKVSKVMRGPDGDKDIESDEDLEYELAEAQKAVDSLPPSKDIDSDEDLEYEIAEAQKAVDSDLLSTGPQA